ncbi:hypothetical protein B0H10DRAFT_2189745 [Mycena sp. CBHHK59/15]|nr:hypothetical protein B0H10DRAFT_2189745 [Mycena sp. CBHHK59/15]
MPNGHFRFLGMGTVTVQYGIRLRVIRHTPTVHSLVSFVVLKLRGNQARNSPEFTPFGPESERVLEHSIARPMTPTTSPLFARERIKRAHKGRETRGVLAKSTKRTVGSSTWSIVRFFLASSLLFLLPPLAYLLAVTTTAWFSAAPSQGINTYLISSIDPLTLAGATYAYWTPACAYFVYLGHSHAFTAVKYQTFRTPWRFRRDHVSHMRLDRLRRAWPGHDSSGNTSKTYSSDGVIMIFVNVASADTVALAVTPATSISDIREVICHRGYIPCSDQGPIYVSGLWRPLRSSETMSSLGVMSLRHFSMPPRLLGGTDETVVLNEYGWEQCGLNPDGSLKEASNIQFSNHGPDSRLPSPAPSEAGT